MVLGPETMADLGAQWSYLVRGKLVRTNKIKIAKKGWRLEVYSL
jgi:hypothetical protein